MLSVEEQVARISRDWPGFRATARTSWLVAWRGELRPFHRPYRLKVLYGLGRDLGHAEILACWPRVTVEDPLLSRRPDAPDEPIPHHYPNGADPSRPILCLYDPREGQWGPDLAIAETIVPWAVNWLACYEGWRATGEWTGGGRHPAR